MLSGNDARTTMAEVVFASQLRFFFSADRQWCEAHILPLLNWEDPVRARRAWDGYLISGRWSDQLLGAGLLDGYLATADYLSEFRDELQRAYCSHLAGVAMFSEADPLPWIRQLMVTVDGVNRVEWINQVAWTLREMPADAVEAQWRRWMRPYWQGRLDSIPVQLTTDEASAMADWVIYLTDSIEEGVGLATAHAAGLREHAGTLHELDDQLLASPRALGKLIAHLMRGTQPPFWDAHDLAELVPKLRRGGADVVDIDAIVEEAIRLGSPRAAQW